VKPYLSTAICPACASQTGALAASFSVTATTIERKTRELICVSCGWHWLGTETELSAARAAEAAWHARTDGELGPWSNVLTRHARRHRAQVLLFRAGGDR